MSVNFCKNCKYFVSQVEFNDGVFDLCWCIESNLGQNGIYHKWEKIINYFDDPADQTREKMKRFSIEHLNTKIFLIDPIAKGNDYCCFKFERELLNG